jgi:hypothetical protein
MSSEDCSGPCEAFDGLVSGNDARIVPLLLGMLLHVRLCTDNGGCELMNIVGVPLIFTSDKF